MTCSNAADLALDFPMLASKQYVWDHFRPTPVMSTYTLAIMVSQFGYTEAFSKNGNRFCNWFYKENLNWTKKATKNAIIIMDYFQENVFQKLLNPLQKIDVVPNKDM